MQQNDIEGDELFVKTLKKLLVDYLGNSVKGVGLTVEIEQTLHRPFSTIYFIKAYTPSGSQRYVAKRIAHHEMNKDITAITNQAVVEFEILTRLHPAFSYLDKCHVPQPILVIPDLETYVMSYVDGAIVSDLNKYARVLSSKEGFLFLNECYYNIGRWLRHFQEVTGIRSASQDCMHGVISRCNQRLSFIERSGDLRFPADLIGKVSSFVSSKVSEISGPIPVSGRHGDFTPWNVLANNNGITVIDFMGYFEEPLLVDVCKMLVYLEDEGFCLTSSKKRVSSLRSAFDDGYGGIPREWDTIALVCETMQRVVSIWGCISTPKRSIHHKLEADMRIRAHLKWLIKVMGTS